MKRYFTFLSIILSALFAQAQQRMNIIFMMSDDHAYQAISAYGFNYNQTPNIDALAKKGMLFNRAFVTNSICGPSRAVMLTGKYSHKNGFYDNENSVFDESQQTIAPLLQKAGYQTAIVGKWHLGRNPQGFDYWNIVPGQGDYYNPDFIENGVQTRRKGYVTTLTMDYALDWLKKRDVNKPFFLICNQKAPHRNWMPETKYLYLFSDTQFPTPKNYFDDYKNRSSAAGENEMNIYRDMNWAYDLKLISKEVDNPKGLESGWNEIYNRMNADEKAAWNKAYQPIVDAFNKSGLKGKKLAEYKLRRYLQDYLRCIQSVDDNVGRMTAFLKANNLDKNTIVIYTSDQGFYMGEHGWFDKRWMYEQSFRTPLIVHWPGVTTSAQKSDEMVMNLDFAETILDMTGQKIPQDMQGKSFVPILKNQLQTPFRDAIYYHYYEAGEHHVARHIGARTAQYKLIYFYDKNEWELFDLKADPDEMQSVYDSPKYTSIRREMKNKLRQLQKDYQDPDPKIPAGN